MSRILSSAPESVTLGMLQAFSSNCLLDESGACLVTFEECSWIMVVEPDSHLISFTDKSPVGLDDELSTFQYPVYAVTSPVNQGFPTVHYRGFDSRSISWWRSHGLQKQEGHIDVQSLIAQI
jgi:hypothetical protein